MGLDAAVAKDLLKHGNVGFFSLWQQGHHAHAGTKRAPSVQSACNGTRLKGNQTLAGVHRGMLPHR